MNKSEYHVYLRSPQWQAKRRERLAMDGYRCQTAGCDADQQLNVHHKTYERCGGAELMEDLVTVCRPCHGKIHATHQRMLDEVTAQILTQGDYIMAAPRISIPLTREIRAILRTLPGEMINSAVLEEHLSKPVPDRRRITDTLRVITTKYPNELRAQNPHGSKHFWYMTPPFDNREMLLVEPTVEAPPTPPQPAYDREDELEHLRQEIARLRSQLPKLFGPPEKFTPVDHYHNGDGLPWMVWENENGEKIKAFNQDNPERNKFDWCPKCS